MSLPPRLAAGRSRALGLPTRGTTNPNRLRRMDNWILASLTDRIRRPEALVVDLGYGASPITTVELHARLRRANPQLTVVGLEIDVDRVNAAQLAARSGLRFERGGFELAGHRPVLVRVANVLRQYPEPAVAGAWRRMADQLAPGGVIVEGTCDELGRRGSWLLLDQTGPISLTISCRLANLQRPSAVADRLVKALIHHNVPGQPVHALLRDLDAGWDRHAGLAAYGPRQRWRAACAELAKQWPVLDPPSRHRHGELTVAWSAVAPS